MRSAVSLVMLAISVAIACAKQRSPVEFVINGVVRDDKTARALPGAQVSIEGKNLGMLTDTQGRFELRGVLPTGAHSLKVQLIGYSKINLPIRIPAGRRIAIGDVRMKQTVLQVDDLVVTGKPQRPPNVSGCYAMRYSNWSPALHPGNARYQLPPDTIRLDTIRGTTGWERDRFMVRPLLPVGIESSAFWDQYENTVVITYNTGMAGSRSRLRISGDTLRGGIETWVDVVGNPDPRGTATAVRVSCPERLRSVR